MITAPERRLANCIAIIADDHYATGSICTAELELSLDGKTLPIKPERKILPVFVLPEDFPVRPAVPSLGANRSHSISLMIRFRPLKRMTISAQSDYRISTYGFADGSTNRVESFNASLGITGTVFGISCHSVLGVNPAVLSAQSTAYELYPNWHVVLSRYFSKIHLGISLFADDILHSSRPVKSTISGSGFVQHSLAQRIGRNFQLAIYWEFGKFKNPPKVENEAYDAF